jgi:electron transfer flavoprotein alpha subunit
MIYGEVTEQGDISPITLELLNPGKLLANSLGGELSLVLMGNGIAEAADEVACLGADKVYVVESPLFKDFLADLWVEGLEKLCREIEPHILIMGHTETGMDVAPRLAFRLNAQLTMDCIDIELDTEDELLLRTKPIFGGNVNGVFKCEGNPQFVTVRPKAFDPVEDEQSKGEIISFDVGVDASMAKVELIDRVREEVVELDKAAVIVAGGRGIEEPEKLTDIRELLNLLKRYFDNGEIGCTRPLVDVGWLSSPHQVGLTGQKVAPELYVAVGLSGASQHVAGITRAKKVVAINKSEEAPIFKAADYGVVAEYEDVLAAFRHRLEELT